MSVSRRLSAAWAAIIAAVSAASIAAVSASSIAVVSPARIAAVVAASKPVAKSRVETGFQRKARPGPGHNPKLCMYVMM